MELEHWDSLSGSETSGSNERLIPRVILRRVEVFGAACQMVTGAQYCVPVRLSGIDNRQNGNNHFQS